MIGGWEQDGIASVILSRYLVLPSRPYKSTSTDGWNGSDTIIWEVLGGGLQDGIASVILSGYLVLPSHPYKFTSTD